MEDRLTLDKVSVLEKKRVEEHLPRRRKSEGKEERMTRMDSFEFLTMAGGGVIMGAAIYLVTLFAG